MKIVKASYFINTMHFYIILIKGSVKTINKVSAAFIIGLKERS